MELDLYVCRFFNELNQRYGAAFIACEHHILKYEKMGIKIEKKNKVEQSPTEKINCDDCARAVLRAQTRKPANAIE